MGVILHNGNKKNIIDFTVSVTFFDLL